MPQTLTIVTIVVVLIVVVALVVYLLLIINALRKAGENLGQLAEGLVQIESHTQPLPEKLSTINEALHQLLSGLLAVNDDLAAVARLLRR